MNSIDTEKCNGCKLCVEVCPCNILDMDENNKVYFIEDRISICVECGQCMAVCKTESVLIDGFSYDEDFVGLPENMTDYRDFYNLIASRRSIRNFKNKPVPDELIDQILEAVSFAPFGAGPEKMNITIVNGREKIEKSLPLIESFLDSIVKWMENPIARYMVKRKNTSDTFNTIKSHLYPKAKLNNYKLEFGDRITRGAPALLILHANKEAEEHEKNGLIYATYASLAAHALGLGATMIGIVPPAINKVDELKHYFQIPDDHKAVMTVVIGYPKYKYQRAIRKQRFSTNWIN